MAGKSPGQLAFQLSFQVSPIILQNGIAEFMPGGLLPIIVLTQGISFVGGLLSGGSDLDLDDFFASFEPIIGGTLIAQQIGTYPFANQQVAANATIAQPLQISLIMNTPARGTGGYATKFATMMTLQAAIANHNSSGGSYIIATPAFIYSNCVMLGLQDISEASQKQPQSRWRWDFIQPLLTLEQAAQAQNSLMSKITSGAQITGQPAWSGPASQVGQTGGNVGPLVVPAQSNTAGSSVPISLGSN